MRMHDVLRSVLRDDVALRSVERDIFSVIPKKDQGHHYDKAARFYDWMIGNRFYNRIMWGNWPGQYQDFCSQVLASATHGPVLDAGCGTLVFTARVYAQCERPVILMDRSLGMLRRARSRLISQAGKVPESVILLQADIFNLPFRNHAFSTVQSFGMLHLFEDTHRLLNELQRVKSMDGGLFLSSLAANNLLGESYLKLLQRHNEVALCETSFQLQQRLKVAGVDCNLSTVGNMAYFIKLDEANCFTHTNENMGH